MSKLLVFNWKMNPAKLKEALDLAKKSDSKDAIVAPPFIFLEEVGKLLKKAKLGAQDLSWEEGGAFTGEVSAEELKSIGVEYVIIGHSERRQKLNETDEIINKKVLAALNAGLKVILCVGEPERDLRNKIYSFKKTKNYIKNQLDRDLRGVLNLKSKILNLTVAYEPVWAIGTGQADAPEDAIKIMNFIKRILKSKIKNQKSKILYGGSVTSKNIKNFVKFKEIDGFLVGGASLKPKEIIKIIEICLKK